MGRATSETTRLVWSFLSLLVVPAFYVSADRVVTRIRAARGRMRRVAEPVPDVVGRAAPGQVAVATAPGESSPSGVERHQAKNREMVRRMLMLMIAYR